MSTFVVFIAAEAPLAFVTCVVVISLALLPLLMLVMLALQLLLLEVLLLLLLSLLLLKSLLSLFGFFLGGFFGGFVLHAFGGEKTKLLLHLEEGDSHATNGAALACDFLFLSLFLFLLLKFGLGRGRGEIWGEVLGKGDGVVGGVACG